MGNSVYIERLIVDTITAHTLKVKAAENNPKIVYSSCSLSGVSFTAKYPAKQQ